MGERTTTEELHTETSNEYIVSQQLIIYLSHSLSSNVRSGSSTAIQMEFSNTLDGCYDRVSVLEHVVVQVTLSFNVSDGPPGGRGNITMTLTSPRNTSSTILHERERDTVSEGYDNWPFLSVHFWGEFPTGNWTLTVQNRGENGTVVVSNLSLTLYGTSAPPASIQSECDPSCSNGCWGEDSKSCVQCRNLRDSETLECIDQCPETYQNTHGYCVPPDSCLACLRQKRDGEGCLCSEGMDSGTNGLSLTSSLLVLLTLWLLIMDRT